MKVEPFARDVLQSGNEYFDRHIRSALEDFEGEFIFACYPDNAELFFLDTDFHSSEKEEKEREVEYLHRVMFEKDAPLYLHGRNGSVFRIEKDKAYDFFVKFCAELLGREIRVANLEAV